MWLVRYVASTGFSKSKEEVVAPNCKVATYSLVFACSSPICFVACPVQIVITPVAKGSSVPVCPTLSFLIPIRWQTRYRTLDTKLKEVQV